jgi:hypothetical protein
MRNAYRILIGKPEEIEHFGDLEENGRVILRSILKEGICEDMKWRAIMRFVSF